MDSRNFSNRDLDIDLESGTHAVIGEDEGCGDVGSSIGHAKKLLNQVWTGFDGSIKGEGDIIDGPFENGEALMDRRFEGEEKVGLLEKRPAERARKKGCRKPPKPPRPPRAPSLDAADQKLVREISELTMMKRARIERMKTLKNMRNAKGSSSGSSLCALLVTILFCFVIIWQGLFSKGSSSVNFQGSPESSVGNRGGLILEQFDRNFSSGPHRSNSASPKYKAMRNSNAF